MPLVKFIKNHGLYPAQRRVLDQLPEQDALGLELDARGVAHAVFEPDLVTDLAAELHAEFARNTGCQQPGGQPARLENDDLAIAQQAMFEEHLGDLGGFAGAGRRLEDEPLRRLERSDDVGFDFVNGQPVGHATNPSERRKLLAKGFLSR